MSSSNGSKPKSWLEQIMDATKELESPRRYFYWSALAALSAVCKNNIFISKKGAYNLYPNIYVFLVGKSGMRKAIPVHMAKKLVKLTGNTRVISGRSSIEGIMDDLAHTESRPDGSVNKTASGFIVSGEFSQAVLENEDAMTILTNLYDGQWNEDFEIKLKSGKSDLPFPYVTMLAGSAPAHFKRFFGRREMEGGFLARTNMIYEQVKNAKNALVDYEDEVREDEVADVIEYSRFLPKLLEISRVQGRFKFSREAGEIYEKWYNEFEPPEDDNTGVGNRIHDTIIKVAMLIALSESLEFVLRAHHIREAMAVCFECQLNMNRVVMKSGDHPQAGQTKLILDALLGSPNFEARRTRLLGRFWGELDALDLDRIIDTLRQANAIEEPRRIVGDTVYQLRKEIVMQYLEHEKQISREIH